MTVTPHTRLDPDPIRPASPDRRSIERILLTHAQRDLPRYLRLRRYYHNPLGAGRTRSDQRPAQAEGLPPRLQRPSAGMSTDRPDREVVIENDIAWRVHALADFMFAAPPIFKSLASTDGLARDIEALLKQTFTDAGGAVFFQNLANLGSVYGHADVLALFDPAGRAVRLSIIDAPRGIAVTDPADYRRLHTYLIHQEEPAPDAAAPGLLARARQRVTGGPHAQTRPSIERTTVWTDHDVREFIGTPSTLGVKRRQTASAVNRLGRIPVVHVQNLPLPFSYSGLSDVEPLIPLQDELNTRLSDRANRLTFQSFKMYLGVGIERFTERPVGPGQMWATDNPDARILEFGGDSHNPSEQAHINEIREAMDKASSVTPIAAGILRGKVGNLTSENALRIVLLGLLAKTRKKRMTYGVGLEQLADLILHTADAEGLLPNRPEDRRVRIDWPDPLPTGQEQSLKTAQLKRDVGVPAEQVLAELGYDAKD